MTRDRRRVMGVLAALCVVALMLTGCAGSGGPRQTDEIRIILGHGAALGNPRSDAALEFARLVDEKSGGTMRVQIIGQETVGSDSEMMVSVAAGSLDMTINSQGPFASYVPEAALIGLPFLFENSEHAYQIIDGPVAAALADEAQTKGFHVLGFWSNGMRDITTSNTPINSAADVAGLKIRVPDDPMTISIFNAFGANPTPLAFGELYLALRQGAVDGQENPVVNVKSALLQEVQNHLAVTGHKYEVNPFLMSNQRWERMEPEQQRIVTEAAVEAQQVQRTLFSQQTAQIYAEFAEIMQVTNPDRDALRQATLGVYDQSRTEHPEFFDLITQAADATRPQFEGAAL